MSDAFRAGDRVLYVPGHARGDTSHPDVERGRVSSIGSTGIVFVRFDAKVARHGWEGAAAEACDPETLVRA